MDQKPVPISPAQWPEARSFERLYHGNPEIQARFVQALIGFRAMLEWKNDCESSAAVNKILIEFTHRFPEYIAPHKGADLDKELMANDYIPDDRLMSFLPDGLINYD